MNSESGHERAGQQQDDGIDDEEEQAKGQNSKGEGEEFEEKSQGGVEKADNQRRDQGAAETGNLKPGNQAGDDDECKRAEQPHQQ